MIRPMQQVRRLGAGLMALALTLAAGPALAAMPAAAGAITALTRTSEGVALPSEPVLGKPVPWEMGLQPGYSPVKREMISLNHMVLWIIIVITLFVDRAAAVGDHPLQRQAQSGADPEPCTTRSWRSPGPSSRC